MKVTIITGPQGSGKTTLARAMCYYRSSTEISAGPITTQRNLAASIPHGTDVVILDECYPIAFDLVRTAMKAEGPDLIVVTTLKKEDVRELLFGTTYALIDLYWFKAKFSVPPPAPKDPQQVRQARIDMNGRSYLVQVVVTNDEPQAGDAVLLKDGLLGTIHSRSGERYVLMGGDAPHVSWVKKLKI